MKISLNWLRERLDLPADAAGIAQRLTMAGLECEIETLSADPLDGVVVGAITGVEAHPDADRLTVCTVDVGDGTPRQIVCGAPNARTGLRVPAALPGARLPDGTEIGEARLRGVSSAGMLCSAVELDLADKSEGLLELDAGATVGQPLAEYLGLPDALLVLELTPNRGDCLGLLGLTRELAAIYDLPLPMQEAPVAEVQAKTCLNVEVENFQACPAYAGRVIEEVNPAARTPDWMRERLRRCGVRSISALVDVTNYVLLELGQPMHAFDAAKLNGAVRVRQARDGERLILLNDQTVALTPQDLLITDKRGPLALAGVMGGADSEVGDATTAVFLESACFAPQAVAGTGRRHKLHSDALHRFERGVDPALQRLALERASELIVAICGGRPGPVTFTGEERPAPVEVGLRHERLNALVGCCIPADIVEVLLRRLGVETRRDGADAWIASVPSHRYDLRIEADLIEEVARLYGYDRIPAAPYDASLSPAPLPESRRTQGRVKRWLAARGWQEAVTYSFVDPGLQQVLQPDAAPLRLDNPIAETLSVMRTSLWTGLLPALQYNLQRQQRRVRMFEIGGCFAAASGGLMETLRIAGAACGPVHPENWGDKPRATDFFDVKADIDGVFPGLRYEAGEHPALHPGQTARAWRGERAVGWLGTLHPRLLAELDLPAAPVLFELDWDGVNESTLPSRPVVSEYPQSRRDLALLVADEVPAQALLDAARAAAGEQLRQIVVFDVYRGSGLPNGFKSIALGLIFQDYSRTLKDEEVDAAVQSVAARLHQELGASVRG